MHVHRHY